MSRSRRVLVVGGGRQRVFSRSNWVLEGGGGRVERLRYSFSSPQDGVWLFRVHHGDGGLL